MVYLLYMTHVHNIRLLRNIRFISNITLLFVCLSLEQSYIKSGKLKHNIGDGMKNETKTL